MRWSKFQSLFLDQYFPEVVRDQLKEEFLQCKQLTQTTAEYEVRLTSLSRFAGDIVKSEREKCRRFEKGLKTSIKPLVVALYHKKYKKVVNAARRLEADHTETAEIKKRSAIMRRGASSVPVHQYHHQSQIRFIKGWIFCLSPSMGLHALV